ncbi:MAG: class I poly(R)-hydroxyalkanoic acid synthase [Burkholderiales bacterium]
MQSLIEHFLRHLPDGAGAELRELLAGVESGSDSALRALEENFYRDHFALWRSMTEPGAASVQLHPDPRFSAPAWRELPYFRYLHQSYLLNARFVAERVALGQLDPARKRRLEFLVRQFLDALSPANVAATNPEVIRLATQTGGESLARGMKLLAADMARGRITLTDENAFEVGRDLASTPGAVVLENDVMQLIQYSATTARVFKRPLLIVPPFINKYYVLDLQPENSFVRYCTQQGFTTFVVSWRNVPEELGTLTWNDYVEKGVHLPIHAARTIAGADKINVLGFCVGGTLLATALAKAAKSTPEPVASLTLLATLLDFSDTGEIGVYVDRTFVEKAEREFQHGGLMPGSRLAATFATLRANDLIWKPVIDAYLKGQSPRAFDLLYWNADSSNVPGRLYAFYLRNMYLENKLKMTDQIVLDNVALDPGAIKLPSYLFAAKDDHIVPWRSAFQSVALLGPPSTFVLGSSGHVAGVVSPPSSKARHFWSDAVQQNTPEIWLKTALRREGSWWAHWANWLTSWAGPKTKAPVALGHPEFPHVEVAPGRYVRVRNEGK